MKKLLIAIALALMSGVASADKVYPDYAIKEITDGFLATIEKERAGASKLCSLKTEPFEGGTVMTFKCSHKPFECAIFFPPQDTGGVMPLGCEPNADYVEDKPA